MLKAGMVLQNRYQIINVIGHGGMSTVYQAKDLQSDRLLAIKDVAYSGKTNGQIVEQSLVAEGKMLMQLSNSHLPRIYDVIEGSDGFMLVMDFIEGKSLDKVIAQQGPQDMEKVLDWGMQICRVLHYLHSQPTPIIYRDMKPANVILKPDGKLMLIDFGTARTQKVGVEMQADTICIGTAGFAAPEQFGGIGQSDARTDIFCLGATLYNMITGHSPSDRPQGILPLERWNPALAKAPLAGIIYKCTRNDPNERYQTAKELHEQLRLVSEGMYRSATGLLGLKRSQWQQQDNRGKGIIGGGLSSLLQSVKPTTRRNSGALEKEQPLHTSAVPQKPPSKPQPIKTTPPTSRERQESYAVPEPRQNMAHKAVAPYPQSAKISETADDGLSQLVLIGAVTAVVFVLLTVVLAILHELTGAIIALAISLCGAILAVTSLLLQRRK